MSTVQPQNVAYKERFPKAAQEMEERLSKFIQENMELTVKVTNDPVTSFVHHQMMEMAKDCLEHSQEKLLTSHYFYEMSENLQKLLNESREKSNTATVHLKGLIKKLLIIISRPARLLECLEFNPQEFNKLIETVEEQRNFHGLKIDIPNYIINKLRIAKNPLLDLVCDNEADIFDNDDKDTDDSKNEESDNHNTDISKPPSEDDYEMIKLISNGAYGCVHLVRHKETRQRFAMKKIDKQNLILRNQVEQAFAERDIMSFTDNPFVVSLYCSFDTKRYLCMVMEYVEGGDCATLLKSMGPLPVDLARFYFAETVLAVEYLHSYGIVHRDLKPDNLLITSMGHIKLTDFGLSKIGLMNLATNLYEGYLDKDTKQFNDKQVCGTPEYIAPEVISRQGYGKPVDWWSMGIILYEFLIGCVPFFGETPEELFAHVINDEVCWPDDDDWPLPEETKHLINQLLQQNPIDRLGTGGAHEVKEHGFFDGLNWDDLLRQKAEFVPQLDNEEDTSYFDTRADRYNHEVGDSEEQDDTDESSSSMFSSFSSCSPKYHRVYSRIEKELAQEKLMKSSSTSSIADEGHSPINRLISPSLEGNLIRTQSLNENRDGKLQGNIEVPTVVDTEIKKEVEKDLKDKEKLCTTPESSQTESEDFSPKSHRKRKQFINIKLASLPKFSISSEIEDTKQAKDESDASDKGNKNSESNEETQKKCETPPLPNLPHSPTSRISLTSKCQVRGRSVIKSASATGLSLMLPNEETKSKSNLGSSGGSSTSSRDTSPNREVNGILNQLKPPIIIRKGPRGFGFTLRAIRVYYEDSDIYTVHHLVLAVDNNSPAFEAGLRPTDLITHINGEPIQGLLHHQVLQLVLSGGDKINIRTTPLENTTIKSGGRKRNPSTIRMTRRPNVVKYRKAPTIKRSDSDKKRRSSLLRRLSSKRASAEIQQLIASGSSSPPLLTPSRSYQSLHRPVSGNESSLTSTPISNNVPRFPRSPPSNRLHFSTSDSSAANSSQSSSPSSSVPNSPASLGHFPHFPRPCTLSGLKHKSVQTFRSPRRKSLGHIPLSPLARTPSPSLLPLNPTSPNRSPCTINFPVGHQPGSSQTTQSFIIQKNPVTNSIAFTQTDAITTPLTSVGKCFSRPKSAEPSSPLLGRALSPDRAILNRTSDKSVLTRLKRHSLAGCVSSPLAISSLPPSKGTNCKSYSKLIESTGSPENSEEDISDERTIRVDRKEEKSETKSKVKLEVKNDNASENASRSTRGSSINIILSKPNEVEKDNDKPSLIPVPSNNTKKKLEGKTSSPINFRKSLFKQNSGKRSRSTSRLKEETQVKK